ncbi:MAG: serine/threonine-protein kinase, partial [Candidatus Rokuibacteriota bacterium]
EKDDEGPLIRVAEAISDGAPVDWQKETSEHGALRAKLGRLRLLEAVASAHRDAAGASAVDSSGSSPVATTFGEADPMARTGGDPVVHPSHWGPLLILEKLDTGGFADVYRAHDPKLQREVALKLRHLGKTGNGSRSRDFLDEARRLARVRHPNVVVVHGADKHDGMVGLWTDLLEGKTLERCLTQQGPFSAHEAALVGIDLCGALAAVHAAGLVHRDVKTTNVMREKGGRIVLMDFGSASEVDAGGADNSRQRAGTPLAMAPEVLLHGEPPSRSADIYGLGVLLYRLVSARYPIEVQNLSELVEKHREGARVPLRDVRPDLPLPFVDIVERALDPDPTRRHASAGAMEQALVASLDARKPDRPDPAPRLRWPYRAAAAAIVAVLGLTIWALWPRPLAVETSLVRHASGQGAREIL